MSISNYYNKIIEFQATHNSLLNTLANHLIVIFAFFVPLSMTGRRATFFVLFLVFLIRGNYLDYFRQGVKDKLVQAFLIYFLIHIIWLIGTENFDQAKRVIHEAKFLLYPLLFITLIDKKFLPRIFSAFFLGMLLSELWSYGIFFEILPPNIHDGHQGTPADPTPVFHHTHYGFMLAITITLVLQRFFYEKDPPLVKAVIIFFFVTATINIFITAGRTGYVLYILLLLTLFLLVFKKRIFVALGAVLAVCSVTFVLAFNFSDTFHQRFVQTITSVESMYKQQNYNSSLGARAAVLLHSQELVAQNWIVGVGTGDHLDAVRKELLEKHPQHAGFAKMFQHLHNEYFTAILQFGVIGLLAFLYLIYQLVRYPQNNPSTKNMQIILAVGIAAFGFIDIVLLGLGALLVLVTLVSISFNKYTVTNAYYTPMSKANLAKYSVAVVALELISWVT